MATPPVIFLWRALYEGNDTVNVIYSVMQIRLFADDYVLFREIKCPGYQTELENNLKT